MFQCGGGETGDLGTVIPAAETGSGESVRECLVVQAFLRGHDTPLEGEADLGRDAQTAEVVGFDGAEVAFGGDMEADGLDDLGREALFEPASGEFLVLIVDAVVGGIVGKSVEQMADIVEQGGDDECGGSLLLFGEPGGLECVFLLRDRLPAVLGLAAFAEEREDLFGDGMMHTHGSFTNAKQRTSSIATRVVIGWARGRAIGMRKKLR